MRTQYAPEYQRTQYMPQSSWEHSICPWVSENTLYAPEYLRCTWVFENTVCPWVSENTVCPWVVLRMLEDTRKVCKKTRPRLFFLRASLVSFQYRRVFYHVHSNSIKWKQFCISVYIMTCFFCLLFRNLVSDEYSTVYIFLTCIKWHILHFFYWKVQNTGYVFVTCVSVFLDGVGLLVIVPMKPVLFSTIKA